VGEVTDGWRAIEQLTGFKGRKPVAELRPVPAGRLLGELEDVLRSLPALNAAEAADFAADIESESQKLARRIDPSPGWSLPLVPIGGDASEFSWDNPLDCHDAIRRIALQRTVRSLHPTCGH
jgi:hypothetical protein